jgi:hypothetical protein
MRSRSSFLFGFLLASPLLLAARPAIAADYFVDRLTDSASGACTAAPNDCSLRRAVLLANADAAADVIWLTLPGTYVLSLAGSGEDAGLTGDLDVTNGLRIEGLGPERTAIFASGLDRVLDVQTSGATVTLRGVTLHGGVAPAGELGGGGIRVREGSLRLETCVLRDNQAPSGAGSALYYTNNLPQAGPAEIVDSWITGNTGNQSAVFSGRGLRLDHTTVSANSAGSGDATITFTDPDQRGSHLRQTTISGNTGWGGGLKLLGGAQDVEIAGCTITANGGGTLVLNSGASANLSNTILVGACSGAALPATLGGNLESPGHTCGLGAGDLEDVATPGLSALGWFGGPSPVHQLAASSPALDAAIAAPNCTAEDQRWLARPRDGDGTGGAVCDIGAVELAGPDEVFAETFECGFTSGWTLAVF